MLESKSTLTQLALMIMGSRSATTAVAQRAAATSAFEAVVKPFMVLDDEDNNRNNDYRSAEVRPAKLKSGRVLCAQSDERARKILK